jgi:hypothetical protein
VLLSFSLLLHLAVSTYKLAHLLGSGRKTGNGLAFTLNLARCPRL